MTEQRKRVRVALELDQSEYDAMQQIIAAYNDIAAPLKLTRTELIRTAIRKELNQMAAQLQRLRGG